eukprot:3224281-Ditylum_brightwellii.AAC.1
MASTADTITAVAPVMRPQPVLGSTGNARMLESMHWMSIKTFFSTKWKSAYLPSSTSVLLPLILTNASNLAEEGVKCLLITRQCPITFFSVEFTASFSSSDSFMRWPKWSRTALSEILWQ